MIPVSKPIITNKAKKYVLDCLKSGWISSAGHYVTEFENYFAKYISVKYAVTTTSGTSALHLAMHALGLGKGDEVIVPAFTMISPVFAIIYTGATPVFVDSEEETWNMDVNLIEKKVSKKTKAIVAVHTYGHPVDLDPLVKIAEKHHLYLIEDGAEGLGAEYRGKKIGSFGILGCFSFYANKTVTTGEGGMVVTNNKILRKKLLSLKNMAHSPKRRFLHTELGFTYRMTNIQAALGLAQLEIIDKTIKKKVAIAGFYNSRLKNLEGTTLPSEKPWVKNIYWMYGILVENKDKVRSELLKRGVDTREFFIPMHHQPILAKLNLAKGKYPISDKLSKHGLYLPSGPNITNKELIKVCQALEEVI